MSRPLPSQSRLHELFTCVGGRLYWLVRPAHRVRVGDRAGCPQKTGKNRGRRNIRVDRVQYHEARIIWMWYHGVDPGDLEVDHLDEDPTNNDIWNLQLLESGQNKTKHNNQHPRDSTGRFIQKIGTNTY